MIHNSVLGYDTNGVNGHRTTDMVTLSSPDNCRNSWIIFISSHSTKFCTTIKHREIRDVHSIVVVQLEKMINKNNIYGISKKIKNSIEFIFHI